MEQLNENNNKNSDKNENIYPFKVDNEFKPKKQPLSYYHIENDFLKNLYDKELKLDLKIKKL